MYTILGKVKYVDESGVCQGFVTGGYVLPYFKQVDSGSNPSKWSDNVYAIDPANEGYYSFDIEDYDILAPDSYYRKGTDRFYLPFFWNANDNTDTSKDSTAITHAGFIDHQLTFGEDLVELNLTLVPVKGPNVTTYSLPSETTINVGDTLSMSETSELDTTWFTPTGCDPSWFQTEISQKATYDGETIFGGYRFTEVVYDWGENEGQDVVAKATDGSTNSTHTFLTPGTKTISITIKTAWGAEETFSKEITVAYGAPVIDFEWDPAGTIKGNTPVTFTNLTSAGGRESTFTYDWSIGNELPDGTDNTTTLLGQAFSVSPVIQYTSSGYFPVTMTCHWNDGSNDQTTTVSKNVSVEKFDISIDFMWDKIANHRDDPVTFSADVTGDTSQITFYEWVIPDEYPASAEGAYTFADDEVSKYGEGSPDNTQLVTNTYVASGGSLDEQTVRFHSGTPRDIRLTVTYSTGFETLEHEVIKSYTPNTYEITPELIASKLDPVGRMDAVTFSNGSVDDYSNIYDVDLLISDYFSENNIDNPTPGAQLDNSVSYTAQAPDATWNHMFQNDGTNFVDLVVRYDNGWQMITTSDREIVQPRRYLSPTPGITWDPPGDITSRNTVVTFANDTNDPNGLSMEVTWTIEDEYAIDNPDNPQYGIAVVDNSQTYTYEDVLLQPTHSFQSQSTHDITLDLTYDDGFEESVVSASETLQTSATPISIDFEADTSTTHEPGQTITYYLISPSPSILHVDWTLDDVDGLNGNESHLVMFPGKAGSDPVSHAWGYAPRVPFCTSPPGTVPDDQIKKVTAVATYDNGWTVANTASKSRSYLASTNEIDFAIKHQNSVTLTEQCYGVDPIEVWIEREDPGNAATPDSFDISVTDGAEEENQALDYVYSVVFASEGYKTARAVITFDDGYGNAYPYLKTKNIYVTGYVRPDLRVSWSMEDRGDSQMITFTQEHDEAHPRGDITAIKVDFDSDFTDDGIDTTGDGIPDVGTATPEQTFYKLFKPKVSNASVRVTAIWNDGWDNTRTAELLLTMLLDDTLPEFYNVREVRRLTIYRNKDDENYAECSVEDKYSSYWVRYVTEWLDGIHPENHVVVNSIREEIADPDAPEIKSDDQMTTFLVEKDLIVVPVLWTTNAGMLGDTPNVGDTYDMQLETVSHYGEVTYTIHSGTLPAGLSLSADGRITGTVQEVGAKEFTVRATDAKSFADQTFIISIPNRLVEWITPEGALPGVVLGQLVTTQLEATDPDGAALTYKRVAGALPTGMSVSTAGVVGGTPSDVGIYTFAVAASDGTAEVKRVFSIEVDESIVWVTARDLGVFGSGANTVISLAATSTNLPVAYSLEEPSSFAAISGSNLILNLPTVAVETELELTVVATDAQSFTLPRTFVLTVTP